MNHKLLLRILFAIFCVGAILRLIVWYFGPPYQREEFYQCIEPVWLKLSGVGVHTTEWRKGLSSWVLPGYNGAWLTLLAYFGLRGSQLIAPIQLHWALISLLLIWAGWRGGKLLASQVASHLAQRGTPTDFHSVGSLPLGWQGGVLGAALCSTFPLLVLQAPQTLSETPSMLALVWSLVLAHEAVEERSNRLAGLSGVLAAVSVGFRIGNGPLALIPFIVLITGRRWKSLLWFSLLGLIPIVFFGLVDLFTWGKFLVSFINDVRFYFLEGKFSKVNVKPADWYWRTIIDRLPVCIAIFTFIVYRFRKYTWSYLISSFGLLIYLTTQNQKSEHLVIQFWAFLLIATAGVIGGWLSATRYLVREESPNRIKAWFLTYLERSNIQLLSIATIVVFVFADSFVHGAREAIDWTRTVEADAVGSHGLLQAQNWVGKRKDLVGAIIEDEFLGGGYVSFGSSAPMVWLEKSIRHTLVRNPALNYAIVMQSSPNVDLIRHAGYVEIRRFGNYGVFRKLLRTDRP